MEDIGKLKIDLRAVPYATNSHALEYRFNPDQDLTYIKDKSILFGLIKYKKKATISTEWHSLSWFVNYSTSKYYEYNDSFNWGPIWCNDKKSLDYFRSFLHTYNDLLDFIARHNKAEKKEWGIARANWLATQNVIE